MPPRITIPLLLIVLSEAVAAPIPPTLTPTPSTETRTRAAGWGERSWLDQHEDGVAFLRGSDHARGADLVLFGDSITQSFGGEGRRTGQPGRSALAAALPGIVVANQGISGDRTQHLAWRLEQGALAGREPEFVAVMIGTNNLPHDAGAEIGSGIVEVVRTVRRLAPSSTVLLHAIPPRGEDPDDPMRRRRRVANALARSFADSDPDVIWMDPWPLLLDEERRPRFGYMARDAVHLRPLGYELWAARLREVLHRSQQGP